MWLSTSFPKSLHRWYVARPSPEPSLFSSSKWKSNHVRFRSGEISQTTILRFISCKRCMPRSRVARNDLKLNILHSSCRVCYFYRSSHQRPHCKSFYASRRKACLERGGMPNFLAAILCAISFLSSFTPLNPYPNNAESTRYARSSLV